MDLQIIGKFIKERRKEKKLTQVQLANKLNVSEKTISKWECGNGFPDTSLMLPLCKILEISANELLSGKILTSDEYKMQAENNLIQLKAREEHNHKFLLTVENVIGYMASITFLILIFVASFIDMSTWLRIVLIVIGLLNLLLPFIFACALKRTQVIMNVPIAIINTFQRINKFYFLCTMDAPGI